MSLPWEHEDGLRVTTRRARIDKVRDEGTQQLVDLRILKNEVPQKVWRPMDFGFFSIPPKDTDGVVIQMGSRSDRTLYFDGGHKDYRPRNRPAGSAGLFDQYGNLLQTEQNVVTLTHAKKLVFKLGKGYDAKGAAAYSGTAGSLTIDKDNGIELKFGNATVKINASGSEIALGISGGRWVNAKAGKVNLGVTSPFADAVPKVVTDAGPSEIVFAEIS